MALISSNRSAALGNCVRILRPIQQSVACWTIIIVSACVMCLGAIRRYCCDRLAGLNSPSFEARVKGSFGIQIRKAAAFLIQLFLTTAVVRSAKVSGTNATPYLFGMDACKRCHDSSGNQVPRVDLSARFPPYVLECERRLLHFVNQVPKIAKPVLTIVIANVRIKLLTIHPNPGPAKRKECFRCHKFGHLARECRQLDDDESTESAEAAINVEEAFQDVIVPRGIEDLRPFFAKARSQGLMARMDFDYYARHNHIHAANKVTSIAQLRQVWYKYHVTIHTPNAIADLRSSTNRLPARKMVIFNDCVMITQAEITWPNDDDEVEDETDVTETSSIVSLDSIQPDAEALPVRPSNRQMTSDEILRMRHTDQHPFQQAASHLFPNCFVNGVNLSEANTLLDTFIGLMADFGIGYSCTRMVTSILRDNVALVNTIRAFRNRRTNVGFWAPLSVPPPPLPQSLSASHNCATTTALLAKLARLHYHLDACGHDCTQAHLFGANNIRQIQAYYFANELRILWDDNSLSSIPYYTAKTLQLGNFINLDLHAYVGNSKCVISPDARCATALHCNGHVECICCADCFSFGVFTEDFLTNITYQYALRSRVSDVRPHRVQVLSVEDCLQHLDDARSSTMQRRIPTWLVLMRSILGLIFMWIVRKKSSFFTLLWLPFLLKWTRDFCSRSKLPELLIKSRNDVSSMRNVMATRYPEIGSVLDQLTVANSDLCVNQVNTLRCLRTYEQNCTTTGRRFVVPPSSLITAALKDMGDIQKIDTDDLVGARCDACGLTWHGTRGHKCDKHEICQTCHRPVYPFRQYGDIRLRCNYCDTDSFTRDVSDSPITDAPVPMPIYYCDHIHRRAVSNLKLSPCEKFETQPFFEKISYGPHLMGISTQLVPHLPRVDNDNILTMLSSRYLKTVAPPVPGAFDVLEFYSRQVAFPNLGHRTPFDDWANRFPPARARQLRRSREWLRNHQLEANDLLRKVFIKKEKSVKRVADFVARGISSVSDRALCTIGPFCHNTSKAFRRHFQDFEAFPNVFLNYTIGYNPEDLGLKIEAALKRGHGYFNHYDFSRFDSTVSISALDFEQAMYKFAGANFSHKENVVFNAQRKSKMVIVVNGVVAASAKFIGRRQSGDANTTLGNTLINLMAAAVFCHTNGLHATIFACGDDLLIMTAQRIDQSALQRYYCDLGFTIEGDEVPYMSMARFLGGVFIQADKFVDDHWENHILHTPDLVRALPKFSWSQDWHADPNAWLAGVALGWRKFEFMPILGAMIKRCAALTQAATPRQLSRHEMPQILLHPMTSAWRRSESTLMDIAIGYQVPIQVLLADEKLIERVRSVPAFVRLDFVSMTA